MPKATPSASPEEAPCANGHTWSNDYGDDWHPDVGMLCDSRQKQWGIQLPAAEIPSEEQEPK
jgi:hypothetical protein